MESILLHGSYDCFLSVQDPVEPPKSYSDASSAGNCAAVPTKRSSEHGWSRLRILKVWGPEAQPSFLAFCFFSHMSHHHVRVCELHFGGSFVTRAAGLVSSKRLLKLLGHAVAGSQEFVRLSAAFWFIYGAPGFKQILGRNAC